MSFQSSPTASKRRPPLGTLPNAAAAAGTTRRSSLAKPSISSDIPLDEGASPAQKKARRSASKRVSFGGEQIKLFNNEHNAEWDDSPPSLAQPLLSPAPQHPPSSPSPQRDAAADSPRRSPRRSPRVAKRQASPARLGNGDEDDSGLAFDDADVRGMRSSSPSANYATDSMFMDEDVAAGVAPSRLSGIYGDDPTVVIPIPRPAFASSGSVDRSASIFRRDSMQSTQSNLSDGDDITLQMTGIGGLISMDEPAGAETSRPSESPALSSGGGSPFASVAEVELSMNGGDIALGDSSNGAPCARILDVDESANAETSRPGLKSQALSPGGGSPFATVAEVEMSMDDDDVTLGPTSNLLGTLVEVDEAGAGPGTIRRMVESSHVEHDQIPEVKPAIERPVLPEMRQLFVADHTGDDDTTIHYHDDPATELASKPSVSEPPMKEDIAEKALQEIAALEDAKNDMETTQAKISIPVPEEVPAYRDIATPESISNPIARKSPAKEALQVKPAEESVGYQDAGTGHESAMTKMVIPPDEEVKPAEGAVGCQDAGTGHESALTKIAIRPAEEVEAIPPAGELEEKEASSPVLKTFLEAVGINFPDALLDFFPRTDSIALGLSDSGDEGAERTSAEVRQSRLSKNVHSAARSEASLKLLDSAVKNMRKGLEVRQNRISELTQAIEKNPPKFFKLVTDTGPGKLKQSELSAMRLEFSRLQKVSRMIAKREHATLRAEREKTIAAAEASQVNALRNDIDSLSEVKDATLTECGKLNEIIAEEDLSLYIEEAVSSEIDPSVTADLRSEISSHAASLYRTENAIETAKENEKAMKDELAALASSNPEIEEELREARGFARASSKADMQKLVDQRRDDHRLLSAVTGIHPRKLSDSDVQVRLLGVLDVSFALDGDAVSAVECTALLEQCGVDLSTPHGKFVHKAVALLADQFLKHVGAVNQIPSVLQRSVAFLMQVLNIDPIMAKYNRLREARYTTAELPLSSPSAAEVNILAEYHSTPLHWKFDVKMTIVAVPPLWKGSDAGFGSLQVRIDAVDSRIGDCPSVDKICATIASDGKVLAVHPLENALQRVWTLLL